MHHLLERQLVKAFGSLDSVPKEFLRILEAVDRTYAAVDEDRALMERSLEISSREMADKTARLDQQLRDAVARTEQMGKTEAALLNALEDAVHLEASLKGHARRQTAAAEFGKFAIATERLQIILDKATEIVAEALEVKFAKIQESDPASGTLLLRAGVGWTKESNFKNSAVVGPDSPAGYALAGNAPVVIEDLGREDRFAVPEVLRAHGIVSGALVVVRGVGGEVYGVLGAHSEHARHFSAEEVAFLETIAGITGAAIERNHARKKVVELNELKSRFIQIVSHQFRTPLNAIRWSLEAMLADEVGPLSVAQKEFLRVTYNANLSVIERIHDLLFALDIEEGRVSMGREPFSLDDLWGSVMTGLMHRCAVKGVACRIAPAPPAPLRVSGDREKIRLAMEKFADNAISYTPDGGKIDVRMFEKGDRVRFEISDTGVGIPEAEQPRIFHRFYRASNAATMKPDSSGLGLFIAKFVIEQHGGSVGFLSGSGEGTTFWFELPRDEDGQ